MLDRARPHCYRLRAMSEPESQGGLPPAVIPGPRRPAGCLRACTVLLGIGFMASMALLVVLWTFSDKFVDMVVQSHVEAFKRALEQTTLPREEREHGQDVVTRLGKKISDQTIKRDENLDPWPKVEQIWKDFRSDTDGGQKILTPVSARQYIARMQEILDDLEERQAAEPPKPQ